MQVYILFYLVNLNIFELFLDLYVSIFMPEITSQDLRSISFPF